jgi:hypothetical protein
MGVLAKSQRASPIAAKTLQLNRFLEEPGGKSSYRSLRNVAGLPPCP